MNQQESQRPDAIRGASGSPWAWLPLGLLFALATRIQLTEMYAFSFEPDYFLPMLAAGLAWRFGRRAFPVLITFGALTLLNVSMSNDYNFLSFGFSTETCVLSAFATAAFLRPPAENPGSILRLPWRRAAQLALILLVIASHVSFSIDRTLAGMLSTHLQPVTIAAFLILGAMVRWPEVVRRAVNSGSLPAAIVVAFIALTAIATLVNVDYGDEVRTHFGISSAGAWLFALCLGCAAARLIAWPWLLVLLAAGYGGEIALTHLGALLQAAGGSDAMAGESVSLEEIVVTAVKRARPDDLVMLMNCASAALLGAALAPFWRERFISPLQHWRTSCLLGAALALQLLIPLRYFYLPSPAIAGGCAFVCGLAWRGRGVILAPLVIQLCCALTALALAGDWQVDILSEQVRVGAIVFPFAFIGLLANRWADRTPA